MINIDHLAIFDVFFSSLVRENWIKEKYVAKSFVRPYKSLRLKLTSSSKTCFDTNSGVCSLKIEDGLECNQQSGAIEETLNSKIIFVTSPNELLHLSCAYGDVALMSYALALNADKNSILDETDMSVADELSELPIVKKIRINGYTPLISAVHSGLVIAVELLLLNGAKLNDCDFNGQTALHHATILKDLK